MEIDEDLEWFAGIKTLCDDLAMKIKDLEESLVDAFKRRVEQVEQWSLLSVIW